MARELIKTDKNGTKYFRTVETCWKCNGTGTYRWGAVINGVCSYAGTCYNCDGTGKAETIEKEYTPEHLAKLEKARERRWAKIEAENAQREAEREAKRQAAEEAQRAREAAWEAERAQSQYIGSEGDRIDMFVTFDYKTSYQVESYGGYGKTTMHIYGLKDEQGNALVWKTSAFLEREVCVNKEHDRWEVQAPHQKGDKLHIKATISGHNEYKGQKQTLLKRVKLLEVINL